MRDDIPGIIHPGCWTSAPGGSVEPGETHDEAVRREMKEEFNIEIKGSEPLFTYALEGEFPGNYFVFFAKLASPMSQVQCNEGQRVEFFPPQDALMLEQPGVSTNILKKYLAKIEVNT